MIVAEAVLDVATPTGPMRTYLYLPREPGRPLQTRPGLVLYSEIFQQTPPVRRIAITFASMGYLVAVPEVYHAHEAPGTVLGYDDTGKNRGNALKGIIPLAAFDDDAHALVQSLQNHPECNGRIGAVGICLGGHLAFRAALVPGLLATACFYPTDLHSGTLGHGGDADFPVEEGLQIASIVNVGLDRGLVELGLGHSASFGWNDGGAPTDQQIRRFRLTPL